MMFAGVNTWDWVRVRIGNAIEDRMVAHATPTMIYIRRLKFRRKDGSLIRPKRHRLSASSFRQFRLAQPSEQQK